MSSASDDPFLPFFPRGPGPLVSLLVPTRGRPEVLAKTIRACVGRAKDPGRLEFVVKVDDDDAASDAEMGRLIRVFPGVKFTVYRCATGGNGYRDVHLWFNKLASLASGDWLFLLCDDTEIVTQDWDDVIWYSVVPRANVGASEIAVLYPNGDPGFFILRREVFQLLGHLSLHPSLDLWVDLVMRSLRVATTVPIELQGLDDTKQSEEKEWERECIVSEAADFRGPVVRDVVRLNERLEDLESRAVWRDSPVSMGWYVWRSTDGRRETVQVRGGGVARPYLLPFTRCGVPPEKLLAPGTKWHRLGEYASQDEESK